MEQKLSSLANLAKRAQQALEYIPRLFTVNLQRHAIRPLPIHHSPYQAEDINLVRAALKLSTKFLRVLPKPQDENSLSPVSYLNEAAVLSILNKAPPLEIALAVCYIPFDIVQNSVDNPVGKHNYLRKFYAALERKHKKGQLPPLSPLIEEMLSHPPNSWKIEPLQNVRTVLAFIASSIRHNKLNTVDLSDGLCSEEIIREIVKSKEDTLIKRLLARTSPPYKKEVSSNSSQTIAQDEIIFEVARLASLIFDNGKRKWGNQESMPLSWHTGEVGIMLLMSGAAFETVCAGFLHDFLEEYPQFKNGFFQAVACDNELRQNPRLCAFLIKTRKRIRRLIGAKAEDLVEKATELGREENAEIGWNRRKFSVMERVLRPDADSSKEITKELATLLCAAKCSTLAALNKGLYQIIRSCSKNPREPSSLEDIKRQFSSLSGGSILSNAVHFGWYRAVFEEQNIPQPLLEVYEREFIERFIGLMTHPLLNGESSFAKPDISQMNPEEASSLLESELIRIAQRGEEFLNERTAPPPKDAAKDP